MPSEEQFCLEVSGDFACFTRPEMKVERVSYDVITPSAARGIFEAILWKPAIRWQVEKIEVLKPIKWVSIRRNEIDSVLAESNIKKAMKGGAMPALYIDEIKPDGKLKHRQQRAGLFLRDLAYRLYARFQLQDDSAHQHRFPHLHCDDAPCENSYPKFADMFKRRARKGQCFNQPYLGTREFSASFRYIEPGHTTEAPIKEDRDLSWMLYDMDYNKPEDPQPLFFNAVMENGIVRVPDRESGEVRG